MEHGYDTRVGGGGAHLSGGERQRIAIARAMLKNAPVVILDEATAYIDPENEAVVQRAVAKLVEGKTVIVIAHRLSTITGADQAAMKYPAWVCWSWEKYLVTALPRILTANKPSACQGETV